MTRFFILVLTVDVVALAAPTRWMGYRVEIALAILLALLTGVLWYLIRVRPNEP